MLVLGVDPGQTSCGLVVRDGATLITHATVIRNKSWDRGEWVDHCLTEALDLLPESGGPHLDYAMYLVVNSLDDVANILEDYPLPA